MEVIVGLLCLGVGVVAFISWWKIFEKAGEAGWKIFIPFYNIFIIGKIAVGNGWIILILMLIPYLNIIVGIYCYFKLGERFGKDIGFKILLCIPIVCIFGLYHLAFNENCVYKSQI